MAPGADYEMQGMRYQGGGGVRSQELVATSVGAAAAMDAHRGMQQSKVGEDFSFVSSHSSNTSYFSGKSRSDG